MAPTCPPAGSWQMRWCGWSTARPPLSMADSTEVERLLDALDVHANRDQAREILQTVVRLATAGTDRLDLKITNAALREMADAFAMFAPYKQERKITMFGSARTLPTDPLYAQ